MILKFTDFYPPREAGKSPRAKGADGLSYFLNKEVVDLVQYSLGTPLDVVTETKQSGAGKPYHVVVSAKHPVAAAGPESPTPTPIPQATETAGPTSTSRPADSPISVASRVIDQTSHKSFDSRSDEINRQSARRDAVSLVVAGIFPADHLWDLIDKLAAYTYHSPEKTAAGAITSAQQHLEAARQIQRDIRAEYTDEDAVCPSCGRREYLKQWSGGWFCAKSKEAGVPGGCGYPAKGERLDHPVSYGEWKQREASFRRPDAVVVSPQSHPTR